MSAKDDALALNPNLICKKFKVGKKDHYFIFEDGKIPAKKTKANLFNLCVGSGATAREAWKDANEAVQMLDRVLKAKPNKLPPAPLGEPGMVLVYDHKGADWSHLKTPCVEVPGPSQEELAEDRRWAFYAALALSVIGAGLSILGSVH